jgi:hypothetical protein
VLNVGFLMEIILCFSFCNSLLQLFFLQLYYY